MNKKYFFFDYDGTLSDRRNNTLVPSSKLALELLQASGHFVALATGRSHYKAVPVLEKLGITNMVCNDGGGLVLNNELVSYKPLDDKKVKQVLKEAIDNNIGYELQIDDTINVYSDSDLFIRQCGGRKEPTNYITDPNFDYKKCDTVYKGYLSIKPEDEYLLPSLKEIGKLRFMPEYINIQHNNKKQGIIDMMNVLNASIEDVVVFGDDTNDINMFDKRWTSIAVGNACEELKVIADYVTDNSYDDGVYNACKKFGWIK